MSQLVKAVQYVDTKDRVIINQGFSPLFTDLVEVKSYSHQDCLIGHKYRIGVKIEATATIPESKILSDHVHVNKTLDLDHIDTAVDRVKRQIVEAVFGEFRQDFERVHMALNNYDVETARLMLIELQEKMYGIS